MTQKIDYESGKELKRGYLQGGISWLLDVPELYKRRSPGMTCMSALENARGEDYIDDFLENPRNDSKGCGGLMRVAPLGLHYHSGTIKSLDWEGAMISAITHGHSLGYMTSAVLTHILNRIVYPIEMLSLKEIICEARDTVTEIFLGDNHLNELCESINRALDFSNNDKSDIENISSLGQGWVAEETLAIAIYCALRYEKDFSKGIIAAVNHSGDSDSTGSVAGNILGAIHGYSAIEDKWKKDLQLHDVILEMGQDLCYGCLMTEFGSYEDKDWFRKYVMMKWKE